MPKFETIKPGDVLYDVRRVKMGNTTMSRTESYEVHVVSVDAEKRSAKVHWNVKFNPLETYSERRLSRLKRAPHNAKCTCGHERPLHRRRGGCEDTAPSILRPGEYVRCGCARFIARAEKMPAKGGG